MTKRQQQADSVSDAAAAYTGDKLGDFQNSNKTGADYSYDANDNTAGSDYSYDVNGNIDDR